MSRRLPIWQLYERARSLGLAVQVSAQSWQGLAGDDDERYRIAASADGGIWLLRTPHPEPVTGLAGMRKLTDTTRRLLGVPVWGHQGTSRIRQAPGRGPGPDPLPSTSARSAYIYRGGVTYVQVKRLIGGPAALPGPAGWRPPGPDGSRPARRGAASRRPGSRRAGRPPAGAATRPGQPAPRPYGGGRAVRRPGAA